MAKLFSIKEKYSNRIYSKEKLVEFRRQNVNVDKDEFCLIYTLYIFGVTNSLVDTKWHYVACVIDRDGDGQVYVDGEASGSVVVIGSEVLATITSARVGMDAYDTLSAFNGSIDDVMIFNKALSEDEIKAIYEVQRK